MKERKITDKEIELLRPYTKKRKVSLWGTPSMVTPCLIRTVFGNGKQLMGFQTLNSRPKYYLVLVDSKTPIDNDDAFDEFFEKHFGIFPDVIYQAIEEEYGNANDLENNYENNNNSPCRKFNKGIDCCQCDKKYDCKWTKWPALNDDCGCSWWQEASTKELKKCFEKHKEQK